MRRQNPRHLRICVPDLSDPRIAEAPVSMRLPTVWRALWCLVFLTGLVVVSVLYTLGWTREDGLKIFRPRIGSGTWLDWKSGVSDEVESVEAQLPEGLHPIEFLMSQAGKHFDALIATETTTLHH